MYEAFLDRYKTQLNQAVQGVDPAVFDRAVALLSQTYRAGGQVFVMGNGGSAATANHFVCDFGKNAVQDPAKPRFRMLSLCDNVEKITAFGNDVSFDEIFRQQLINLLHPGDLLIAVSASGNSPDLVKACAYAKERGARLVTLSGFRGGEIKAYADAAFVVPLESYEMIEDVHLNILHMVVCCFKEHPQLL